MVVGNGRDIRQLVGPDEFATLVDVLIHLAVDIVAIRSARVVPALALIYVIVVAQCGFELEVWQELILAINGVEISGDVFATRVVGLREQRVAVVVAYKVAVPCAVFIIHGI